MNPWIIFLRILPESAFKKKLEKIFYRYHNRRVISRMIKRGDLFRDRSELGFHGDSEFRNLIRQIISNLPVSSFVETGTYMGDSTSYVAKLNRNLPIFSCEINDDFFGVGKRQLEGFENVELHKSSSPEFIENLLESNRLGDLPVFFLDAHWYSYWPLEDEINIISSSGMSCVIVIDDFKVPGRPEFVYSKYRIDGEKKVSGFELIKPTMNRKNTYNVLFPSYSKGSAFSKGKMGQLAGHVVIFQNLESEFKSFKKLDAVSRSYSEFKLIFEE